jgi:hypothetical protein
VAEVVLDQPGIRALVGQGVAAGVAQHVRVGRQRQPGPLAALGVCLELPKNPTILGCGGYSR